MPSRGLMRRADRAMEAKDTIALLKRAEVMRIGTVDKEGWPYVVPFSFVYHDGKIYFHHTAEASHLTSNINVSPRICIEVDEPGPVFSEGKSGCDVSRVFHSAIAYGKASLVTDAKRKKEAFDHLMVKYADPAWKLPSEYPTMDTTLVFQVDIEKLTGKQRLMKAKPS